MSSRVRASIKVGPDFSPFAWHADLFAGGLAGACSRTELCPHSFESVIPVTTYEQGRVSEIRLYPIAIDRVSGPAGGSPFLAPPEQALRILERMKAMSVLFGTVLRIEQGVGFIKP